jgi:pyruvate dehydrogenase E1 component alpha subunit
MADPSAYRDSSEVVEWQEKDPIDNLRKLAIKHNIFEESDLEKIDEGVQKTIDDAVAFADESDEPDMSELYNNIYENI